MSVTNQIEAHIEAAELHSQAAVRSQRKQHHAAAQVWATLAVAQAQIATAKLTVLQNRMLSHR